MLAVFLVLMVVWIIKNLGFSLNEMGVLFMTYYVDLQCFFFDFCAFLMKWALPFLCFTDLCGNVLLDSTWILISGNGSVHIALFSCFFFAL